VPSQPSVVEGRWWNGGHGLSVADPIGLCHHSWLPGHSPHTRCSQCPTPTSSGPLRETEAVGTGQSGRLFPSRRHRCRRCGPGWRMSGRARCLLSIRCRRAVGRGGRAGARLRQDPDHRLGRSRARGAGAAIVTIPVGAVTLRRPRPRKRRGGWPAEHPSPTWVPRCARLVGAVRIASLTTGLVNGVQDGSAIPANVTTQATTQLEASVPFTSDSDRKAQLQKANVPPDQAGCDSESQQRRPPCRAPRLGWSRSSPSSPCSSPD
jgi:hypothetical protein